jgi:hypothetical protein
LEIVGCDVHPCILLGLANGAAGEAGLGGGAAIEAGLKEVASVGDDLWSASREEDLVAAE